MFDQDYNFGTTFVYCDKKNCNSKEEIEGFDGHCLLYADVAEEIKELGWVIKYEDGEWCHYCPDCIDN